MEDIERIAESGWSHLEAGRTEEARQAAQTILDRAPDSISALSLRAAIHVEASELKEALELCLQAREIDPEDPRPHIQGAEIHLYSEDPENALLFATAAIDVCGDEADFVDAVLIKGTAECELERLEDARRSLAELDHVVIDEAPLWARVGDLALDLDEWERAKLAFGECIKLEPDATEAHYGLAAALYSLEDEDGATRAMLEVRRLDAAAAAPDWQRSREQIESIVRQVVPDAPIAIEQTPSEDDVRAGVDARTPCLFDGETWRIFHATLDRFGDVDDDLLEELREAVADEREDA